MNCRRVFQVRNRSTEQFRRFLKLSEPLIARCTEKPSNSICRVVMVDANALTSCVAAPPTNGALPILGLVQHRVSAGRQSVPSLNLAIFDRWVGVVSRLVADAQNTKSVLALTPSFTLGIQTRLADVVATIAKVSVADKILQRLDDFAQRACLRAVDTSHDLLVTAVLLGNRARFARGVMAVFVALVSVKIGQRFLFAAQATGLGIHVGKHSAMRFVLQ